MFNIDTLISNVTAVTMNESLDVLFGAYIGITDGKITYLGKSAPAEAPATIIDGTGMVAMPGLVNCHTALAATALRNYLDDVPHLEALEQQLKLEAKMDSRCAKAAATLGIAECLRFGITSVSDLYYYPEATAQAALDAGIKANIALSAQRFVDENEEFDFDTDQQCQLLSKTVDAYHLAGDGLIRVDAGIHSEYTSNFKLWEALAGFACEKGIGMQLHLAQTQGEVDSCLDRTGLSPVELLSIHRLFHVSATAAGCNCLEDMDRKLLAKHKVSLVALPIADGKNGRQPMDIPAAVKAGANVALGTGSALECGNLDLFEAMRFAAMDARRTSGDADAMPAIAPLMMATVSGATAQGRSNECGMLKEGFDADLCLVDFSAPHLMPCHNVVSGLVFSAKGGDVALTMVRGKILYQNGLFPTIDLKAAVEELTGYAIPKIFAKD